MHFSGIVVTVPADRTEAAATDLGALPGVEVHVRDAASGSLVVTLESVDPEAVEASYRRIRAVPGVIAADLAYHFVDDETGDASSPPPVVEIRQPGGCGS